jgi:hypothetical protein
VVDVPAGFVTDLTSIPRSFWSVFPKTGRYAYAAVVHDYLYWNQPVNREKADEILEIAMKDSQVPAANVRIISTAVRLGGKSAWDDNTTRKTAGEKRILKQFPENLLISWNEWRQRPGVFAD